MAYSKTLLDDIKKDLVKARLIERPPNTKQIIDELAADIHAQLKQGALLDEVYKIIRARLPSDTKLTLATFKKYWRESRDLAGLSKIKNSGRKKNLETTSAAKKIIHVVTADAPKSVTPSRTVSEFRADPDDM